MVTLCLHRIKLQPSQHLHTVASHVMNDDPSAARQPGIPDRSTAENHPLYQAYPVYTTTPEIIVPPGPQRKCSFCAWLARAIFGVLAFVAVFTTGMWLVRGMIVRPQFSRFALTHCSQEGFPIPTYPAQWSYDTGSSWLDYNGCVPGHEWKPWENSTFNGFPNSSITTFDIPLSDGLLLIQQGDLYGGKATYKTSSKQPTGTANVQITGWYRRQDLFALVKACSIQIRAVNGQHGIMFLVST